MKIVTKNYPRMANVGPQAQVVPGDYVKKRRTIWRIVDITVRRVRNVLGQYCDRTFIAVEQVCAADGTAKIKGKREEWPVVYGPEYVPYTLEAIQADLNDAHRRMACAEEKRRYVLNVAKTLGRTLKV